MPDVVFMDQSRGILRVTYNRIAGEGIITPLLVIEAEMETLDEGVQITPFNMTTKLQLGNEIIGRGSLRKCGEVIKRYSSQVRFELQTTQRAINYVNEQFREPYLSFTLTFDSLLHHANTNNNQNRMIKPADSGLVFQVSKLDWLKKVLEPIKYADFALLEFPIPEIPNKEMWTKVLNHISGAEAQYRNGDDPGVFSRCYAAYEAIKPVEKHLESIDNEDKRKAVKSVLGDMRRFFNEGRHVENAGVQSGEFPVDHRDAEFALCLVKSAIVYLAKIVHKV